MNGLNLFPKASSNSLESGSMSGCPRDGCARACVMCTHVFDVMRGGGGKGGGGGNRWNIQTCHKSAPNIYIVAPGARYLGTVILEFEFGLHLLQVHLVHLSQYR